MNNDQRCRCGEINPISGLLVTCEAGPCAERRSDLIALEGRVAGVVQTLLVDHAVRPRRIVEEVARIAPAGSLAVRLVTIELICRAGHWLGRSDLHDLLDEVDELAEAIPDNGSIERDDASGIEMVTGGFYVGTTIPGWLIRDDLSNGRMVDLRDGVRDLIDAAADLVA